jgi:hypothetical protein
MDTAITYRPTCVRHRWLLAIPIAALLAGSAAAVEVETLKVKREAVFEFAKRPTMTQSGDHVTITFETTSFCDATAAIEDDSGRILRHLASGVLDTNGNVIVRIGRYGNVYDGMPLVKPNPLLQGRQGGQPPNPRPIGGDETAIMHAQAVAFATDQRLFIADSGNQCVRSVRLGYHTTERAALKDVAECLEGD